MVKSVRLDARTEARLREAARLSRVPESRIIRDAVAERTDAILANRLDYQIAETRGRSRPSSIETNPPIMPASTP